jgi:hypothetical protein
MRIYASGLYARFGNHGTDNALVDPLIAKVIERAAGASILLRAEGLGAAKRRDDR